jgi:hypothetical protein
MSSEKSYRTKSERNRHETNAKGECNIWYVYNSSQLQVDLRGAQLCLVTSRFLVKIWLGINEGCMGLCKWK